VSRHLIPNSTQIPDVILDHWMARLSGAELKVLLYIARRTYGFGKDSDRISMSQIAEGITKRDGTVLDRGTGIARSSVARCLNTLEGMGIVLRKSNVAETGKEFDENAYSINLGWMPDDESGENSRPCGGKSDTDDSGDGVVAKSDYPPSKNQGSKKPARVVSKSDHVVSKQEREWSENGTSVVSKSDIQETDIQETDQETASSSAPLLRPTTPAADGYLDLVRMLVANGVGHSVAEQLAREKPDDCRRCLEYLPFVKLKSTSGAYLANAIRKGYGPPSGFEAAKKGPTPERSKSQRNEQSAEIEGRQIEHKERMLKQKYAEMAASDPVAISEFLAFTESERIKAVRIANQLSPRRRKDILSGWEKEERKLERFERWLASVQRRAGRLIGPAAAFAQRTTGIAPTDVTP
jgi:phage replication O-like protein O